MLSPATTAAAAPPITAMGGSLVSASGVVRVEATRMGPFEEERPRGAGAAVVPPPRLKRSNVTSISGGGGIARRQLETIEFTLPYQICFPANTLLAEFSHSFPRHTNLFIHL